MDGPCREHAFHDLPDLSLSLLRGLAGRECETEAPVARLVVRTGQDQVTQAGEAHEGLLLGAQCDAEPHHLRQAARDQRDAGVGAEPEAVGDARADRQHVLDCAADLDADHVAGSVGPEPLAGEAAGQRHRIVRIAGGYGHRTREPLADFAREGRPRQHGGWYVRPEDLERNLVRQLARAEFEALGRPGDPLPGLQQRPYALEYLAKRVARDHDEQLFGARHGPGQVVLDFEAIRQADAWQVASIDPVACHGIELLGLDAPKLGRVPRPREVNGERSSPRARAEDSDCRPRLPRVVGHGRNRVS